MSTADVAHRKGAHPNCAGASARWAGWAARALVLAAAVLLAACASPAQRANMEAGGAAADKKNQHGVLVRTGGGQQSGTDAGSAITDNEFKAAIEASLLRSGAFGSVQTTPAGAGYAIAANIFELRRPIFGLSFTVELEVAWTLTRQSDSAVLLRKAIRSSHTATTSDAFAGVTRLRLAVEGAARKNIESFLSELAKVPL